MNFSKQQNMPTISVLVPVHNGGKFLAAALDSITQQTVSPQEIIISDNDSTDTTWEIASNFAQGKSNVKLIRHQPNIGFPANINALVKAASTDFVCILSHDDLLHANYLATMQQALIEEQADLVMSNFQEIDARGNISHVNYIENWKEFIFGKQRTVFHSEDLLLEIIRRRGMPFHFTTLIKRDKFLAVNGYSTTYRYCCDSDFYLRYLLTGVKVCFLAQELLSYRQHATNMTKEGIKQGRMLDEMPYYLAANFPELIAVKNEHKFAFAFRYYGSAIRRLLKASIIGSYPTKLYWQAIGSSMHKFIFSH